MAKNKAAGSISAVAEAAPPPPPASQQQLESASMGPLSSSLHSDGHRFIRTGQARFRVRDVYRAALAIEDAATAEGGFVVHNRIASDVGRRQRHALGEGRLRELAEYSVNGQLVLRVPSERTQALLRTLAQQVEFLDQRQFNAQDAQFDLLRQQLAYQRQQEAQTELGASLAQGGRMVQRADTIAQRQDARAGRDEAQIARRQVEDQIAYATLSLDLYQLPQLRETELVDVDAAFARYQPGLGERLREALASGRDWLLDLVVGVVAAWPLCLLLLGTALGLCRFWIARRRRAPATNTHEE